MVLKAINSAIVQLLVLALSSGACLAQEINEEKYLDVSISLFDANLPSDEKIQKQQNIYPQVRDAESRYMPALLRATLQQSNRWGAIRIIPAINESAELMITGKIIQSDGLQLQLAISVTDATGRQWLHKNYSGLADEAISLNSLNNKGIDIDPFQTVYTQIADELLAIYQQLSPQSLAQIQNIAYLRYGASLSPESFSSYLQFTSEGYYQYTNLPASNDPMALRISEIQQHEYLFIDVVDEQYQQFLMTIKPTYDLWRNYTKDLVQSDLDYQVRQTNGGGFRPGSYRDLRESYDNFRWEKMQAQYLNQLSEGFTNEVLPTEISLEDSVYELSGTLENQYWEWREILKSLVELEKPLLKPPL